MKKTLKYETPEIEVTRFELMQRIMDYGEGESTSEDGKIINVPGESAGDPGEWFPTGEE